LTLKAFLDRTLLPERWPVSCENITAAAFVVPSLLLVVMFDSAHRKEPRFAATSQGVDGKMARKDELGEINRRTMLTATTTIPPQPRWRQASVERRYKASFRLSLE
jgi:hypothetical protein